MASLWMGRKSFERRHRNSVKALLKLLENLPDRPTPDQIHDLRVAVRRIQVVRKLLPKAIREYPDSKRFDLDLKSAMKATSQLRDLDTLMETLAKQPLPPETTINLQNQRSYLAATAREALVALGSAPPPRLHWSLLRGRKISRRLRDRVRRQGKLAAGLVQVVADDESKVAELHSLRKEVKRLRYLLELIDKRSPEVDMLTEWQESLGAIHDLDVAVVYLQARGPDFAKAVRTIQRARHSRYVGFVNKRVHSSTSLLARSKMLSPRPDASAPPI